MIANIEQPKHQISTVEPKDETEKDKDLEVSDRPSRDKTTVEVIAGPEGPEDDVPETGKGGGNDEADAEISTLEPVPEALEYHPPEPSIPPTGRMWGRKTDWRRPDWHAPQLWAPLSQAEKGSYLLSVASW